MNYLDLIILVFALFSAISGFSKGLIIGIASLTGIVLGVIFSLNYASDVAAYFEQVFDKHSLFITLAAYLICFSAILLFVKLIGKSLEKVVEIASLGFLNRMAGAAFGVLKVLFLFSAFFFLLRIADPQSHLIHKETREHSLFYKPLEWLLPSTLPFLKHQLEKIEMPDFMNTDHSASGDGESGNN